MILTLAQNHTTLKKVAAKEWAGPCPECGGKDRFRVWPGKGDGGEWWCRGCNLGGDVLQFLRKIEGKSCPEAHIALGKECRSETCEFRDRCRLGNGGSPKPAIYWPKLATPQAPPERSSTFSPEVAISPADRWQEKALALVTWAHERILEDTEQLDYLNRRGLPLEAVQRFRIGWNPEDRFRSRKSWSLPEEISKKTGKAKKLWIPKGIVIPCFTAGQEIHRVRIRRSEGDPRYFWVPGSGDGNLILNPEAKAHIIVESDLDAFAAAHAAGDLVGVVSLGSSSSKPKESAWDILSGSLCLLVALDADEAGGKAFSWWRKNFAQAQRWPVPKGKDQGDYIKDHGGDLRSWILAGLRKYCPGLAIKGKSETISNPAPVQKEKAPEFQEPVKNVQKREDPPLIGHISGVSTFGRKYHVVPSLEDAQLLEKTCLGEAVLTADELKSMEGMKPEEADKILVVLQTFPGARIQNVRKFWSEGESTIKS